MENAFENVLNAVQRIYDNVVSVFPKLFEWLFEDLNETQKLAFGVDSRVEIIFGVGLIVVLVSIFVKWILDFIPG